MKYKGVGFVQNDIAESGKEKMTFANMLFAWVLLSLLPQIIFPTTRESTANLALKAFLILTFFLIVFIYLYRKKARANIGEMFLGIMLCLQQIVSDYFIGQQPISFGSVIYIAISSLYYILFFGLMYGEKINAKGIYRIAFLYDLFIIYASVYNFMIYGSSMLNVFSISNTYEMVMRSFFTNRNTFAMFLLYSVIMSVFRLCNPATKKQRIWYWFVLIVAGYSMFCTFARTSLLAAAVFFVIYYVMRKKGEIGKRIFMTLGFLLLIVAVLWVTGAYQFVLDMVIRPEAGSTGRVDRWGMLFEEFMSGNILLGGNSDNEIMPHNTYIYLLLSGGVIMVSFFIVLYCKVFKRICYIFKHDREYGAFFLAMFFSFVGILSMAETVLPVASPANSVVTTLFALILPHYYYNYLIDKEKNARLKGEETSIEKIQPRKEMSNK